MANAKAVTHTFSDGEIISWENFEGTAYFDHSDSGLSNSGDLYIALREYETNPQIAAGVGEVSSQALINAAGCQLLIGIFCVLKRDRQSKLFPNHTIYYNTANATQHKATINAAVTTWNKALADFNRGSWYISDLRWIETTATSSDVVMFYSVPTITGGFCGLVDSVGYNSSAQDTIRLSTEASCQSRTVLHEIGHKMSLEHEHDRCDREKKIEFFRLDPSTLKILASNPTSLSIAQFVIGEKVSEAEADRILESTCNGKNAIGGYDLDSIMQFPPTSGQFLSRGIGFRLVEPVNVTENDHVANLNRLTTVGQGTSLSFKDAFAVGDQYVCFVDGPSSLLQIPKCVPR